MNIGSLGTVQSDLSQIFLTNIERYSPEISGFQNVATATVTSEHGSVEHVLTVVRLVVESH